MTPFLQQVASHYYALKRESIGQLCFVFPNRRSMVFFKKYLMAEVHAAPVVAPRMFTMNDFFYRLSGSGKTDRVHLLLELYSQYKAINPSAESLDDFIFWGDVLLSDFDDVDKYLSDPRKIFANVSEFKNIEDNYEYLTDTQRDAIIRFLEHFRSGASFRSDLEGDKDYKARFLKVWDLLLPLYLSFRNALSTKGLSYEGQVYREIADRLDEESLVDLLADPFPGVDKFVFVGLNVLNECEKKLLRKMHAAGIAEFCWDYYSDWIKDSHNRSSMFMRDNVNEFPQALPDAGNDFSSAQGQDSREFNVLSVPSSIGGAKQLPEILARIREADHVPGIDTAIVLPDEKMLIPVLNSIPEDITKLNVTMGYPMKASELWNLMNDIAGLQMHLRCKDGSQMFYHKQLWSLLSNSIVKNVLSEKGKEIVAEIKKQNRYYIPRELFVGDSLLELIFRPVVTATDVRDSALIRNIGKYLQEVLATLAPMLKDKKDMAIEMDFAKEYYLIVGRLMSHELEVLPATYFRLLDQLVSNLSVPFKGEPLEGLQIMGPLETRALDFENVIILNCNEGVFPRRNVSASFIPPELRRGFGLPAYEHQDAVWAYYFYRLIQRSRKVWMVYDSRTEGTNSGEQSRYIRQLEMHHRIHVNHFVAKSEIGHIDLLHDVPKTKEHVEALHAEGKYLSASALQNYLSCQAKFYYHSVCGLREEDEVSESLDTGMIGNVFHHAMESIYKEGYQDCHGKFKGPRVVTAQELDSIISDKDRIRSIVAGHIMEQLHTFEITGRNLIFEDVICQYVIKALMRDRELLDSYGVGQFTIYGLEKPCSHEIGGYKFIGFIDRLDSFVPGVIRVVDYKTGKVTDSDFIIDESNAGSVVAALFGTDNSKRPKIALQLYLYDVFVRNEPKYEGKKLVNSIYQTSRLFVNPVEMVALNEEFCSLMDAAVEKLLDEISQVGENAVWKRTDDAKTCEYCDFKMICGR